MITLIIVNCIYLVIIILSLLTARRFEKSKQIALTEIEKEIIELNTTIQYQSEELETARDPVGVELKNLEDLKLKIKDIEDEILKYKKGNSI